MLDKNINYYKKQELQQSVIFIELKILLEDITYISIYKII